MSTIHGTPTVPVREATPAQFLYTADVIRRGVVHAKRIRNLNLRRHLRDLARAKRLVSTMPQACAALFHAVETRSRLLTDIHPRELPVVPVLLRAAAYADHFIRPLEAWQAPQDAKPREQLQDLLSYLFDLWPVPPAFAEAWLTPGPLLHQERDWYLHLTRGGSLRHLPHMPVLRKSAAAALPLAPCGLKGGRAVRWAQLQSLQCPQPLMQAVFDSAIAQDFASDRFWLPLIEKAAACGSCEPGDFGIVADGFHQLIASAGMRRAEQLLRLPWPELVSYWQKHWQALFEITMAQQSPGQPDGALIRDKSVRRAMVRAAQRRWEPVPGVYAWESRTFSTPGMPLRWTICELLSHSELIGEGRTLRHCVGTYGPRCLERRSAIFRLRCIPGETKDGRSRFYQPGESCTIEVALPSRRIIQCRARWNRLPDHHTMAVIRAWAEHFRLRMDC